MFTPAGQMHHPLRDLPVDNRDSPFNDAQSDTLSTVTSAFDGEDGERLSVSTGKSYQSLDFSQSLGTLTKSVKPIPLRLVNKPDFPTNLNLHLVQEIFLKFPVFCISSSPDSQYVAVGGGEELEGSSQPGGLITVYPLITARISREHAEDEFYVPPLTCLIYDTECAVSFARRGGAVLDIAWTNKQSGYFFTAGMDKMISLWHISKPGLPLMLLPHPDVVSSIAIHPKDDRLVASGCIDGRLRLWSVEAAKVITSVDLPHPITALCFTPNGHSVIAGTSTGHLCILGFDESGSLKYHSQIHVRSRRGKNEAGTAKVSGLQSVMGPNGDPLVLVTTNDSRVRLYRLRDKEVKVKFHGILNEDSQLKAAIHRDVVCCASEDGRVAMWKVPDLSKSLLQTISEKFRGRILVDSLISFRAALGKVNPSEEEMQTGQPLSTAIMLPDVAFDMLVAAKMRPPTPQTNPHPIHIVTGDMTGRVKIFEWGSDLSAFTLSKETE